MCSDEMPRRRANLLPVARNACAIPGAGTGAGTGTG
jgi:hypothetical protein